MRDKMERLVILPFSVGCVSDASVAVAVHHHQPRRSRPALKRTQEEDEDTLSSENIKYSLKLLPLPKPDISAGFNRLFTKSVKTLSQLFAYKEEIEESENEMEIGFPTEVKHVTHIGLDGSASSSPSSCDNRLSLNDFYTFPMDLQPAATSPLFQAST
ncbi:CRIB domain-containing protein RIC10 [Hibiscus syriacus]|uniref:CRIB domain-containing protein RIC10 n=1 Tax=Hibiscus syriacus TaxID=106335 RepID=A0A6A2YIJ6_HIBSY|nr:CRIB domain-containing protein RIC4-like [Hibiscus syriacus]KAE8676377.1 CRIB domain-containing protein RIC10 [Hibiscus syriacus]